MLQWRDLLSSKTRGGPLSKVAGVGQPPHEPLETLLSASFLPRVSFSRFAFLLLSPFIISIDLRSLLLFMPRHMPAAQFDKWSDEQRRQVLADLLARCSRPQAEFAVEAVRSRVPMQRLDFTRELPRVICLYIFSFLDPRSLCRSAQVSFDRVAICRHPRAPFRTRFPGLLVLEIPGRIGRSLDAEGGSTRLVHERRGSAGGRAGPAVCLQPVEAVLPGQNPRAAGDAPEPGERFRFCRANRARRHSWLLGFPCK